ncbi:MAG: PAS domain S-box protein [Chloroflexi bacterium]|nr:PAS domain S-box protein [Chloroflexota bacterium]
MEIAIHSHAILEGIKHAVIILDNDNRVADINAAAQQLVARPPDQIIGQPAVELFGLFPALYERYRAETNLHTEVILEHGPVKRYFDVSISPLRDPRGRAQGRVIVLEDVSVRKQSEAALHDTTLNIMNRLDVNELLETLIIRAGELLDTPHGVVYLASQGGEQLERRVGTGLFRERMEPRLRPGQGLAGKIWQTGQPLLVADYDEWQGRSPTFPRDLIRALAGVPLYSGPKVVGALALAYDRDATRTFGDRQIELLSRYAQLASMALDNAHLFKSIQAEIAERKQAEAALRESEERHRLLLELSPDPIIVYDMRGNATYLNAAFEQTFGWSRAELLGKPVDFVPADYREQVKQGIQDLMRVGKLYTFETKRLTKDGRLLDVQISASLVKDQDGNPQESLVVLRDVTEHKRMEEELRRQEQYFESIVDHSPVAIVTTDWDATVVSWNPAAETLFGYTAEQAIGRSIDELVANAESMRAEAEGYNEQIRREGSIRAITQRMRRDGALVDVELLALPVKVGGERAGVIAIYHDITELQRARRQAEEANESKSTFLANVSHELRTPLTSVLGFARIIQKRVEDTIFPAVAAHDARAERAMNQVRGNLNIILSEGERLTALINDVLDLAKIEAGKIEWHMQPLAVSEVIERATAATVALFDQKGLRLEKQIAADLPAVVGDRDRLVQVLINLISNAVKFTDQGAVICTASQRGSEISISVADTGIGISPADQAKMFHKFVQAGDTLTDKPRGTGLGLAICRQIVEQHGGRIWVASELGRGSTFTFTLPAQAVESPTAARKIEMNSFVTQLETHLAHTPNSDSTLPKAILIVDDDASIRALLRQELETAGYRVEEARDGLEALTQVKRDRPDLVILDVMMPELNGFDVTAVLRNDPETTNIPIIILSIIHDQARGYRLGVDRYITKPMNVPALLDDVELLVAQGGSKRRARVDEDPKKEM